LKVTIFLALELPKMYHTYIITYRGCSSDLHLFCVWKKIEEWSSQ